MQKYRIYSIIVLLISILTTKILGQANENQLFVITNRIQYKNWLKENSLRYLIPLDMVISPLFSEVPYATPQNFTGKRLYKQHEFWVARDAGILLKNVQDSLKKRGLTLYFFDTYRPYSVTEKMWKIVPDERYAANPANGSGHNRGIAVDVSLADLATGKPLQMPTGYDNFSDTAHHSFMDLPNNILENRSILKGVMEHYGFKALSTEWWHYSLANSKQYPILNLNFKDLRKVIIPKFFIGSTL
jgi:D-alanyl-D-alanine dipeptidase